MNTASPAAKKLQHARFYLEQIRVENQKAVGKDLFAIEAHVSSCFGHIKAAFYRLRTELGARAVQSEASRMESHAVARRGAVF